MNLLVCSCLLIATVANAGVKVGDVFPVVPQAKGKVVLVDFWASWCGPCAGSFPALEEIYNKYKDRGLQIVAVSVDEKAADMQAFLKRHAVSFPIIHDSDHKLVAQADVRTMPTSFLIDETGKVRYLHNGFRGEETKKRYIAEIEELLK